MKLNFSSKTFLNCGTRTTIGKPIVVYCYVEFKKKAEKYQKRIKGKVEVIPLQVRFGPQGG